MKIDVSAIAILLFFVAPGYLAYWIRNHFVPRTLVARGATEELAGFVVVSAFIHCVLGLLATVGLLVHGAIRQCDPASDFTAINHLDISAWWQLHPSNGLIAAILYFLVSCGAGIVLGVPLALSTLTWKSAVWRMIRSEFNDDGAWLMASWNSRTDRRAACYLHCIAARVGRRRQGKIC